MKMTSYRYLSDTGECKETGFGFNQTVLTTVVFVPFFNDLPPAVFLLHEVPVLVIGNYNALLSFCQLQHKSIK